ncbi:hypothetical protein Murru_3372 [Allomuricauda ruestringensis DSM 13258]|uniref:Uncharacterized protein n=1 Tax=Allomuricauda ruestringensis (strain DSM 13258 / CIP 107369 / LMG 19739 / B1) TaxID=886377 RepID=G2PN38_ALLRU|nr:hypothetical protein Murru_3372 [Allomuricauda ruestringensis DSM 13258]
MYELIALGSSINLFVGKENTDLVKVTVILPFWGELRGK